jgi:hypothetical protein
MATVTEVLEMLLPEGGWSVFGNTWDGVTFHEAKPITKAQFDAGVAKYDAWKAEQNAKAENDKVTAQTKLTALGLTVHDLKALGL